MKHELGRLGTDRFEQMIQAIISGTAGFSAAIFGDGPDGQREAVIDEIDIPITGTVKTKGRTIVQAKYKSPDGKEDDWTWLRKNLKSELDRFREKAVSHPEYIPETYLFFTNIILTPTLDSGIRDKADQFAAKYSDLIPDIHIFGADDIRAMLDNYPAVVKTYADFLTPGIVLSNAMDHLDNLMEQPYKHLLEYEQKMLVEDSAVHLEQAGSVAANRSINLRNVYTDLEAKEQGASGNEISGVANYIIQLGNQEHLRKNENYCAPSEGHLSRTEHIPDCNIVLIGNAGQGKSTLCQYICQIYRAALLNCNKQILQEDAHFPIVPKRARIPIQINLKRYAAWINRQEADSDHSVISYVLLELYNRTKAQLTLADFNTLLHNHPWVFLFDGLDEVPASSNRGEVLRQINMFMEYELPAADCDSLVICTSRPQGYDADFSPSRYHHFALQDMSPNLCRSYIERLLETLEDNRDERDRCRAILHNALDDPMVSKLMTTPLYTAIIVLLVKMGGTPPNKRYALFYDYCDIVIKREKQKALLPSLNDDYDWIQKLHAQLGFLLQVESETRENTAAELSVRRCKELIEQFLTSEEFGGDVARKAAEMYDAITKRLTFLAETSGTDQESCVLFPLRSMQEYFAAEWIITFGDDDERSEAMERISLSAYWRNVYLFVAGYFAKNPSRKNMNETLYRICRQNNGDADFPSPRANTEVCQITLSGSWLALDLLCDNLFGKRTDRLRYLRVAAELLEADYDREQLTGRLIQLPSETATLFMQEFITPYLISHSTDASETILLYLWKMANLGNAEAKRLLEIDLEFIKHPQVSVTYAILQSGYKNVGETALNALYLWCTEDLFSYYCRDYRGDGNKYYEFLADYLAWGYVSAPQERLPLAVLRQLAYVLIGKHYRRLPENLKTLTNCDLLLHNIANSRAMQQIALPCKAKGTKLRYRPLLRNELSQGLAEFEAEFQISHLPELSTLICFLCTPTYQGLLRLLEAYRDLPESCKDGFADVLRHYNWLLRDISAHLRAGDEINALLQSYDEAKFEACIERDRVITSLAETGDFIAITKSHYWDAFDTYRDSKLLSMEDIQALLHEADEADIDENFISLLSSITMTSNKFSSELISFGIRHFSTLFRFGNGVDLALCIFRQAPIASLMDGSVVYPKEYPNDDFYIVVRDDKYALEIAEKINRITALGEGYLQAYALLPFLITSPIRGALPSTLIETAELHLREVENTENRLAVLGCTLCMLMRPVSKDYREFIQSVFSEWEQKEFAELVWFYMLARLDSGEKLFIRNLLKQTASKHNTGLIPCYTRSIREDQSSDPVDRNELMRLSTNAHGNHLAL